MKANILIYIIIALASSTATLFGVKALEKPVIIPEQPDCVCPEPTVSVQPFEVEKIKGLKEFVYSPQFTGSISVSGVDSLSVKRMINTSIDAGFKKYFTTDRKGRAIFKSTSIDTRKDWSTIIKAAIDETKKENTLQ